MELLVPDLEYYSKGRRIEPAWAPVFYNPQMKLSRDLSIALIDAYARSRGRSSLRVLEPLSATGVRGLRYAAELDAVESIVLNDRNSLAVRLQFRNTIINRLQAKVRIFNRDANSLMYSLAEAGHRFDIVDIDPFGSPAPFIESALHVIAHKGLLLITATDLAPIFGVYPRACLRKYFSRPLDAEFSKEIGARILAGFVVREAAKHGLGAVPTYTVLTGHSLRLVFSIYRSRSAANRQVAWIGYAAFCPRCSYRALMTRLSATGLRCPNCGGEVLVAGPLWCGGLWSRAYALKVVESYGERAYLDESGLKIAKLICEEAEAPPLYTTVTTVSKIASVEGEPSPRRLLESLLEMGYRASLTHFDSKGLRCTLQPYELANIVKAQNKP